MLRPARWIASVQPMRGTTEGVMVPVAARKRADFFRSRYHTRSIRLARDKAERQERLNQQGLVSNVAQRKVEIAAAVERVRQKRLQREQAKKH